MEEVAPTPMFFKTEEETIQDINEYNMFLDKQEFKIELGKMPSKISIKVEELNRFTNYYYKSDFTLGELKSISKFFRKFNSIGEACDEINEIFKNKKVFLKIESKEELIIYLDIFSFSKTKMENIPLKIKKIIINKEKIDEILMNEINQIKENILNDKKYFEMKINLIEKNYKKKNKKT